MNVVEEAFSRHPNYQFGKKGKVSDFIELPDLAAKYDCSKVLVAPGGIFIHYENRLGCFDPEKLQTIKDYVASCDGKATELIERRYEGKYVKELGNFVYGQNIAFTIHANDGEANIMANIKAHMPPSIPQIPEELNIWDPSFLAVFPNALHQLSNDKVRGLVNLGLDLYDYSTFVRTVEEWQATKNFWVVLGLMTETKKK
jgi:hypothetical protein